MCIVAWVATKVTHGSAWVRLGSWSKFKWRNLFLFIPCSAGNKPNKPTCSTGTRVNIVLDRVTPSQIFCTRTEVALCCWKSIAARLAPVVKDEASNSQAYYQNIVRPDASGLHSCIISIHYDACSCKRNVSTAFTDITSNAVVYKSYLHYK